MLVWFPPITMGDGYYLRSCWEGCLILSAFAGSSVRMLLLVLKSSLLGFPVLPKKAYTSRVPYCVGATQ